ncbi:MAG: hypothetical protein HYV47_02880 [Candidatus Nealsonbacteria bacterium]|nr:hypothetical protein [Candidatus Nealsonbacteria bacterium]
MPKETIFKKQLRKWQNAKEIAILLDTMNVGETIVIVFVMPLGEFLESLFQKATSPFPRNKRR